MDGVDEFAELLGMDPSDPDDERALRLAQVHEGFLATLVALRREHFKQSDFADRMGRDAASVSRFERIGTDPHLSTILRYAVALGVDYSISVEVPVPKKADDNIIHFPFIALDVNDEQDVWKVAAQ
ncbi:helix-turn-helix domain-containing protein [Rhodococcus sp. BH5]|uniref:helix-turn-helix domain-containing protein n=1 Tax=Rhodococcus sp. BH5 TaxID=2871702 RepID=UPI0022CD23FB|nr:helix-turn-helix transcriptional regulator [Rhodococcus sp. BH5]MCZ9634599.1 helix-turn-helix domain-containing protein [Rhodococcus sp. BH5]